MKGRRNGADQLEGDEQRHRYEVAEGYQVVQIPSLTLISYGGSVHCLAHQIADDVSL